MRGLFALAIVLMFAAEKAAAADLADQPGPMGRPIVLSENRDVWIFQSNGSIRHLQSGLVCPTNFNESVVVR